MTADELKATILAMRDLTEVSNAARITLEHGDESIVYRAGLGATVIIRGDVCGVPEAWIDRVELVPASSTNLSTTEGEDR